jgi:thioredoxin reductase (NADPH)
MADKEMKDIIIVGGGPAGLTAGMYASRARMETLLLESFGIMGQATMTDLIENYPGVERSTGYDLIAAFKKQAESFGLNTEQATVKAVSVSGSGRERCFTVTTDSGEYRALSLVIASGASSRKLGVAGEDKFSGKGVSYCATCDGPFFKGAHVAVIGGGDTAVEEAIYLTRFAEKVTIVHRRGRLRSARILQERAESSGKIDFAWDSVVDEIEGEDKVTGIRLKNVKTGALSTLSCGGVFVFIGWDPNTGFLSPEVALDQRGSIVVDKAMRSSLEGLFACGDCTEKVLNQVVTAAGDGATAAFSSQKYVEEIKGQAYK